MTRRDGHTHAAIASVRAEIQALKCRELNVHFWQFLLILFEAG